MSSRPAEESPSDTNDATYLQDAPSSNTLASTIDEIAFLQKATSASGPTEGAQVDISVLLKELEAADGVAQGVESKLDKLLENIEGLLQGLEDVQKVEQEDETGQNDSSSLGKAKPRGA